MHESILDLFFQAVTLLLYMVAGTVLAGFGAVFEYRSYMFISGGEQLLAVWMGGLGLLLLAFAYFIWRDKAAGAFVELRAN